MQGASLRDQAPTFEAEGVEVVGMSFDEPSDNAAFRKENEFPFRLLSDTDRTVGAQYQVVRPADDPYADYPMRVSYLIDPDGVIAKSYEVTDPGGHGAEVLADLGAIKS